MYTKFLKIFSNVNFEQIRYYRNKFIAKIGTYNPLTVPATIQLDRQKALEWLHKGAQPTDRVARFLEAAGVLPKTVRSNPKSAVPGKAMAERAKKKAAAVAVPAEE